MSFQQTLKATVVFRGWGDILGLGLAGAANALTGNKKNPHGREICLSTVEITLAATDGESSMVADLRKFS
jgi:hypothetical protein